jgi:hypothetical protein
MGAIADCHHVDSVRQRAWHWRTVVEDEYLDGHDPRHPLMLTVHERITIRPNLDFGTRLLHIPLINLVSEDIGRQLVLTVARWETITLITAFGSVTLWRLCSDASVSGLLRSGDGTVSPGRVQNFANSQARRFP